MARTGVFFLLTLSAACAFSGQAMDVPADATDSSTTPMIISSTPPDGAAQADGTISATFNEEMDPATLTAATFTLFSNTTATTIPGTVAYASSTVVFTPTVQLASDGAYTATITAAARSESGVALATAASWSFTGTSVTAGVPVNLRTAGDFVILAKAAISGITATVTGNLGVSPAAATYITGCSLIADASNTFATSAQITGRVYAASYAPPTPAYLTTAISDMEAAFTEAGARTPDVSELGAGTIGGMHLASGVYRWSSGLLIGEDLTLTGGPTSVWIFQIAQDLTVNGASHIVLAGGALAKNVFWQVTGAVTLDAASHLEGVVLTQTAVTFAAGATLTGRLLAQTAVNIDGSTVTQPAM